MFAARLLTDPFCHSSGDDVAIFLRICKQAETQFNDAALPPERKQLNTELSAFVVENLLKNGLAGFESAAAAGLELLVILTDTEKLALGIDIVAKAGAMQAILQCLVEHKGTTRVPKLACQASLSGLFGSDTVPLGALCGSNRGASRNGVCARAPGPVVTLLKSLQTICNNNVFLPLQVIDVLGGRLKNREEAANIGVCANILQAVVPSCLKDTEFVKVRASHRTVRFPHRIRCSRSTDAILGLGLALLPQHAVRLHPALLV